MGQMTNAEGERVASNWAAGPNEFVRCPYPDCTHTGERITKVHCRLEHGMEREEIGKLYGYPKVMEGRGAILSENNGRKWYSTGGGFLI